MEGLLKAPVTESVVPPLAGTVTGEAARTRLHPCPPPGQTPLAQVPDGQVPFGQYWEQGDVSWHGAQHPVLLGSG